MKHLAVLFLLFPFSLSAAQNFECTNNKLQLNISVTDQTPKTVEWKMKDDKNLSISGAGLWQKETDSDDAFSSFDEGSALAYKNNRAVFVLGNEQEVLLFSFCKH